MFDNQASTTAAGRRRNDFLCFLLIDYITITFMADFISSCVYYKLHLLYNQVTFTSSQAVM